MDANAIERMIRRDVLPQFGLRAAQKRDARGRFTSEWTEMEGEGFEDACQFYASLEMSPELSMPSSKGWEIPTFIRRKK